ncbi:MAG: FkbM family methyltransferase [Saprospiraceae bacterium]|jgi:FkbM family methyltransferase
MTIIIQNYNMLLFFKTILSNIIQTRRSRFYTWQQKIKIFQTLNSLHLKSLYYTKAKNTVEQKIFNYKVTAYSYESLLYLFREIFIHQDYHFETDKPTVRIIDAGANIGMAILYFKFLFPDCSILAFEPNPDAFHLLQKNVKDNQLENVQLENKALSDEEGTLTLFLNENKGSLVASMRMDRGGNESVSIPSKKLSAVLKKERFDLLKMDIEGAEVKVIHDLVSTNTLSQIDQYLVEYHHKMAEDNSLLSKFLTPFELMGFDYNLRTNFTKVGSFQDVLIHFYHQDKIPNERHK